jgi:hypothetical protein
VSILEIGTQPDRFAALEAGRIQGVMVWETASLAAGVRKGLTPSFGVSGLSDTTFFFASV